MMNVNSEKIYTVVVYMSTECGFTEVLNTSVKHQSANSLSMCLIIQLPLYFLLLDARFHEAPPFYSNAGKTQ